MPAHASVFNSIPSSPTEQEPRPVQTGYLLACMKPSRLSRSLKIHDPESTVKCRLLLQMFPDLGFLLWCLKTSKTHTVSLSNSDTMTFKCSKCKVRQVDTRLSAEHRKILQHNYFQYLEEKEKAVKMTRFLEEMDEFIVNVSEFLSEVKESKEPLQT
ncbi:hypothetical protein VKT23_015211 [Stygiomarasmius scandens]|uniref:Uncharacterized protein n=1 Tax=Marasmiellus scandens TaxID=2682957 RepID=A0ABR1J2W2_9AGAR